MLFKLLYSVHQQIWKTQQWPQNWKRSVFIPIPNEGQCQRTFKLSYNCSLISYPIKVMLKILQARLQIYNSQMYKMGLEKAEEQEIKLPTSIGSQRKQGNSRKTSTFTSSTMLKPLTVWIVTNCGKFLMRWEYQTTLPTS